MWQLLFKWKFFEAFKMMTSKAEKVFCFNKIEERKIHFQIKRVSQNGLAFFGANVAASLSEFPKIYADQDKSSIFVS